MDRDTAFDVAEIRAAERALEAALEATDPTAWVSHYTDDAVLDGGGASAVVGREALLAMARSMQPMTAVAIRDLRTEGQGNLATVWFEASWRSGASDNESTVDARGMILWRKESDDRWRVAIEHLG